MALASHAPVVSASGQADATSIREYCSGWSIQETAGATAQVKLHDGTGTGDPVFLNIKLAANQGLGTSFTPPLGLAKRGVYVELVSGAAEVYIYGG